MAKSFDVVETTLSSAVASGGTFAINYPSGRDAADYDDAVDHIIAGSAGELKAINGDFSPSFGASTITITYNAAGTLPAGAKLWIQLDRLGFEGEVRYADDVSMNRAVPVHISLGAPDTADADGVCASQAITAAGTGTINGALASSGVATFDRPRNVVAAWTATAVMTVTGTDEYGVAMTESSASGTSMTGKKAFKTITAVDVSANVTGATVGTGVVLGLPVFLPQTGLVALEMEDGVKATAGTLVKGADATPTATTGDVRGTYTANSAPDGSAVFSLVAMLFDPSYKGRAQYSA